MKKKSNYNNLNAISINLMDTKAILVNTLKLLNGIS